MEHSIRMYVKHRSKIVRNDFICGNEHWSKFEVKPNKLQKYNVGVMPILSKEHNNVIGIISERDIARYIFKDEFKGDLSVTTIMSKDIISCNLNTSVTELMETFTKKKIRHILIIKEKKLLGMVSIGDVLNYIIDQYKEENKHLRDFINK